MGRKRAGEGFKEGSSQKWKKRAQGAGEIEIVESRDSELTKYHDNGRAGHGAALSDSVHDAHRLHIDAPKLGQISTDSVL